MPMDFNTFAAAHGAPTSSSSGPHDHTEATFNLGNNTPHANTRQSSHNLAQKHAWLQSVEDSDDLDDPSSGGPSGGHSSRENSVDLASNGPQEDGGDGGVEGAGHSGSESPDNRDHVRSPFTY